MDMSEPQSLSPGADEPMAIVFQSDISTTLFFEAWTPRTPGQYAGTCLALVLFTIVLRVLVALKPRLEAKAWSRARHSAHEKRLAGGPDDDGRVGKNLEEGHNGLSRPPAHLQKGLRGHITEGLLMLGMAGYEVFVAFLGYVLMLAVMTMNVGYFVSVLLGVFLGTLGLGGIARDTTSDHC